MIVYLSPEDEIMCKVIKPVGYHDNHEVGEVIAVKAKHVTQMIAEGYIEVYVEVYVVEEIS